MNKKIIGLFILILIIGMHFTGCIDEKDIANNTTIPGIELDNESILPDWMDGEYHDYHKTMNLLNDFQEEYPELVYVFSIGKSVLGRDIWCIQ